MLAAHFAALTPGPAGLQSTTIRIGTRGSPLARAQAVEVAEALREAHRDADLAVAIVPIRTAGDRLTDRPLLEAGGKGLFTKEIEEALLAGEVDIAVHSAKDMPTLLPAGLELAGCLPRQDARDAFIGRSVRHFADLPQGATLGTSSLRRRALALRRRPDLKVVEFRGNVGTRLQKLEEGIADATLLAMAGLHRLDLVDHATAILDAGDFVPAVGQGAIAVELREGDIETMEFVAPILDADAGLAVAAERAYLAVLDGSCRTPIGGHATITAGVMSFHGIIVTPDGRTAHEIDRRGPAGDALRIGRDAGAELARRGGPDFFRH
jgi:hydroxymethylbilane synthase